MNAKLNLFMKRSVIREAKKYAREHRISISKVVETYLNVVSSSGERELSGQPPITSALSGMVKSAVIKDHKKALLRALSDKYL